MNQVDMNYSLWPNWDVIFSDLLDILSLNTYVWTRFFWFVVVFLVSSIFIFIYCFFFVNIVWNIDDYCWWWLSVDSDLSDLFIFSTQYIVNCLLYIYNVWFGSLSSLSYVYFYNINYGLILLFLDYVGLYWILEFCVYNIIGYDNNLVYIYYCDLNLNSIYVLYNYNFVYEHNIYSYLYDSVNYYHMYVNDFDYRQLNINAVVHSLFLINFWVDLLNYFYDVNFFNNLTYIQNLVFGVELNLSWLLLYEMNFSWLFENMSFIFNSNYASDLLNLNGVVLSSIINEIFVDVIDAQYLLNSHFARNFGVFNVENLVLFLFNVPTVYFNFYSSIYYLCFEFHNIINYLMNIYSLNILLYYEIVISMVGYNFWHLTDIFCYLISIFVIC